MNPLLVIRHRALNHPHPNFQAEVEAISKLDEFVVRPKIAVFEGDFHQASWGKDIVMVHAYTCPSKQKFEELRNEGKAAYLPEVLDAYVQFQKQGNTGLCLEAKADVTQETVDNLVSLLQEKNIENAYVDSFFGKPIDYLAQTNRERGTKYRRSLHLCGKLCSWDIAASMPEHKPDMITVPHPCAYFPKTDLPIIYGAIGKRRTARKVAANRQVEGIYWRDTERHWWKMFKNSFGPSVPKSFEV